MKTLALIAFAAVTLAQTAGATEPYQFYTCSNYCDGQTAPPGRTFLVTTLVGFNGKFLGQSCLEWTSLESCEAKVRELETLGELSK